MRYMTMKRRTITKIEKLGEDHAIIKVKRVGQYWIAGGKLTTDDVKTHIKIPCGRGGVIDCTRERAIRGLIHEFGKILADSERFKKAKEILRQIEDSIQPKLF